MTATFHRLFPYYLAIGMTYEQFWEGDVWLAEDYFRANQISAQRKSEEMWLQGLYFYHGVSVALGNAFRKKGAKPIKYMSEPIRIIPMTEEEKKDGCKD